MPSVMEYLYTSHRTCVESFTREQLGHGVNASHYMTWYDFNIEFSWQSGDETPQARGPAILLLIILD